MLGGMMSPLEVSMFEMRVFPAFVHNDVLRGRNYPKGTTLFKVRRNRQAEAPIGVIFDEDGNQEPDTVPLSFWEDLTGRDANGDRFPIYFDSPEAAQAEIAKRMDPLWEPAVMAAGKGARR
jgi:hypothetical protein